MDGNTSRSSFIIQVIPNFQIHFSFSSGSSQNDDFASKHLLFNVQSVELGSSLSKSITHDNPFILIYILPYVWLSVLRYHVSVSSMSHFFFCISSALPCFHQPTSFCPFPDGSFLSYLLASPFTHSLFPRIFSLYASVPCTISCNSSLFTGFFLASWC